MTRCGSSGCDGAAMVWPSTLPSSRKMPSGPKIAEEAELVMPRGMRAPVCEVDDHALIDAVDGRMRRVDEALQPLGWPMIAAGLTAVAVHPLLDHHPAAIIGDDESVQIEIKPVLHGGASM